MNIIFFLKIYIISSFANFVFPKTKDQWKGRVIYQLLTDRFARSDGETSLCNDISDYCGGDFKGIQKNLDYISDMGFNAIWISPIIENTKKGYHGYHGSNLYNINPHFGSEQDFRDLIKACHQRDIWIMVDVVANHVGYVKNDFSDQKPFNKTEYYHEYCEIRQEDYGKDQWKIENCRLAGLPDLDQNNPFVRAQLKQWIMWLINTYEIDGLRIDTVPHVPKNFWEEFNEAAGVFTLGEIFNSDWDYVSGYIGKVDSVVNYPGFYFVRNIFMGGSSLYNIRNYFIQCKKYYNNSFIIGNFLDNHDNPRFLSQLFNHKRLQNAIVFTMAQDGIPIHYYGTEQGYAGGADPRNRETLWTNSNKYIFKIFKQNDIGNIIYINLLHRQLNQEQNMNGGITKLYQNIERYVNDNFYAFSRGMIFFALTNVDFTISIQIGYHPYSEGTILCNIFWQQDCIQIKKNVFSVILLNGEVKIFAPQEIY